MRTLINDQWSFAKLSAGSTLKDAETATFMPVDLPHDWLMKRKICTKRQTPGTGGRLNFLKIMNRW